MKSHLVNRAVMVRKVKDGGVEFSKEAYEFILKVVDGVIEKGIAKAKEAGAKRLKSEHFE